MMTRFAAILLFALFTPSVMAQIEPWEYRFDIDTKNITATIDNTDQYAYVWLKSDKVICFDLVEQEVLSEVIVKDAYSSGNIGFFSGYPFYRITDLPSKVNPDLGRFVLISHYQNKVVLDTDWFELESLDDIYYDIRVGHALVRHKIFKKKKGLAAKVLGKGSESLLRGKGQSTYTLFTFGAFHSKMEISFDSGKKKGLLKSDPEVWKSPAFNNDYLIMGLGSKLYGISLADGNIAWSKDWGKNSNRVYFNNNIATNQFFVWTKSSDEKTLNRFSMATGASTWSEPLDLETKGYQFKIASDTLFVARNNQFHYIDSKSAIPFKNAGIESPSRISKITRNEVGIILENPNKDGVSFNLLRGDQLAFDELVHVKGSALKFLQQAGENYLFFTDLEVGVISSSGAVVSSEAMPLDKQFRWLHDKERNQLVFYTFNHEIKLFNYRTGMLTASTKISLKGDDEFINGFWKVDNGYAVSSKSNLLLVDPGSGEPIYAKYYRNPGISRGLKQALFNVTTFVAGAVFSDQLVDVYNDANEAGLVSASDNWDDVKNAYVLGTGAISAKYANRLIKIRDRLGNSVVFSDKWLVEDRLDDGTFGLKILDVNTGEELRSISISPRKNMDYDIFQQLGGIVFFDKNTLMFEPIGN